MKPTDFIKLSKKENKMEKKLNMTLTLTVDGTEGFDVQVNYNDTTIETVRKVQNALMQALIAINQ